MKNLILTISWNYLFKSHKLNSISKMIKVSFFSIFLATLSLALSFFIMSGFEKTTKEKLKNINPDITLESYGQNLNYEKIAPLLKDVKEIQYFAPIYNQYGILEKNNKINLEKVLIIKGVNPELECKVNNLASSITFPKLELCDIIKNNTVLVGKKFAQLEDLTVGQIFNIVFAKQKKNKKLDFESVEFKVGGFFDTGIEELDNNLIICSIEQLQKIFNTNNVSQISIKIKDENKQKDIANLLESKFGIYAYTWQELNPAIMSALKLEKYITFIILSLLIVIASMNMISLIYMLITNKRKEFAILYTLGLSIKKLKRIFLIITTTISLFATSCGLLVALIIAKLIEMSKIEIPDAYFVTYLPVEIDFYTVGLIFIVALIITILATISPIQNLKKLNISEILRFN